MVDRSSLARGPLWKGFLVFLAPMLLSNVLQALSGTVNSVYLGRMIGVDALAAVSGFFPVLFFFMSFVIGFGSGAAVVVGQAYGARDPEKVKAVAATALAFSVLVGVIVGTLGGIFTEPLLRLVGTPENILPQAVAYGRITLLACPLLFLFILSTVVMRGVGDTMTPLIALIISTVVGLVVTPALIRGWGGLPQLGLNSAAYAGILSWAVTLGLLTIYMRRRGHPLAPDRVMLRHFWIEWHLLKVVLRIGVPTGVQMILMSMAEAAVLSFVNAFGSDATAAYGTVNQVVSYIQFPALSIGITASIFAAQAIGAENITRLGAIVRTALGLNLALTGSLVVLGYLFSRTLIGFFVDDTVVLELAQRLLHITLWSYLVFGWSGIFASVMRASGTVIAPTVIGVFSIVVVEVSSAYILSQHFGIEGIWYAYPIAFTTMMTLQASYYGLVWRKKTISRLV
jgi:putative MATE family efflux protein